MKRYLLVAAFLLAGLSALAEGWYYQNLDAPEGFYGTINGAFIEPKGNAWGATTRGLFRYGYSKEFIWYRADGKPGSLPDDNVLRVVSGSGSAIWVMTSGGIVIYNPTTDSFEPVLLEGDGAIVKGYSYFNDSSGREYIGGDGVLYAYDPDKGTASALGPLGLGEDFAVEDIYPVEDGKLLLFNSISGVAEFFPESGKVSTLQAPEGPVRAHMMDSRSRLWVSSYNRGVNCYSTSGELLYSFTEEDSGLTSNLVTCFLERDGQIVIGTEGGGINFFDPSSGEFHILDRDENIFNSFPCSSVSILAMDSSNSIWAVNSTGDVVLLKQAFMRNYAIAPVYSQTGKSSDSVVSIDECRHNGTQYLLVGTENSGLYRMNMDEESFRDNVVFEPVKGTEQKNVEDIATLPDGRALMALKGYGLYLLNPAENRISPFTVFEKEGLGDKIKYSDSPVNIFVDDVGKAVILMDRAYIWNPRTNEKSISNLYDIETGGPLHSIVGGNNRYFYNRRFIYTWDSTTSSNYQFFDMGPDAAMTTVARDRAGWFWIGTENGLYSLDPSDGTLTALNLDALNSAKIIAPDSNDRLWVGTTTGMYLYLPQLGNVTPFTDNDGSNWNNYNSRAWCLSGNRMYFGGTNGLLSADSELNIQMADKPEISLESLYIDDIRYNYDGKKIKISPYNNSIVINLIAREDNFMRSKIFRYRIESPEQTREVFQSESSLQFDTPEAGSYSIYVSCTMQNGEYTDPVHVVSFKVNPVWYRSITFWLIVLGVILAAVGFAVYTYMKESRYRAALAHSEAEAKAGQESVRFLLNVSHELKTPLTLIISPLSRILKRKSPDDPEYTSLKNIYRQANRMSTLILTVLDAHKIQEGIAKLNAEEVDLNKWIEGIAEGFDDEARGRGMRIARSYDIRLAPVAIDGSKLENVMTNMFINAFKHSPDESVITVGTEAHPGDNFVRVYVSDQGEGLGGVDMTKLFSRFYQGVAQKTGSGLGLAYANSIVELHNGKMGAFDNKKGGATFFFDIPGNIEGPISEEDLRMMGIEERLKKPAGYVEPDPDEFVI